MAPATTLTCNVHFAERFTAKSVANYRADQTVIIYDSRYTLGSNKPPIFSPVLRYMLITRFTLR